jgi:predicted RNase H-like nuclease (RuvC/YqgF family)
VFSIVLYHNRSLPEHRELGQTEETHHVDQHKESAISLEEQIQSLLHENKILKERLNQYEETFEAIDMVEGLEIQRG